LHRAIERLGVALRGFAEVGNFAHELQAGLANLSIGGRRFVLNPGQKDQLLMDYTLTSERLRLRLMELDDAERIFKGYASDPEAARYMVFPTATNVSETIDFLADQKRRFESGQSVLWAIEDRHDGTFFGAIEIAIEGSEGEVGYIIARPYWGCGIVPEALAAVLVFSKEKLHLARVRGCCDIDNLQSARVFEKTGFRSEGIASNSVLHPNISPDMRDARTFALEL
jgi:ribosomal-protein-alanine N-acetyltransferase